MSEQHQPLTLAAIETLDLVRKYPGLKQSTIAEIRNTHRVPAHLQVKKLEAKGLVFRDREGRVWPVVIARSSRRRVATEER